MKKEMKKLKKLSLMCSGSKESEKMFAKDVKTLCENLKGITEGKYDVMNPWDQAVMIVSLTNLLACIEVNARFDGVILDEAIKGCYEDSKKEYLEQVKENILAGRV